MNKIQRTKALIASSVAAVTFMIFLPSLWNGFVNWDDGDYVYKNYFIRSLDIQLLKTAFAEFHYANWHPLTWLSHALDYAIWGLNPLGHHLTNNILHALNTLVVVFLVMRLMEFFKKTEEKNGASQTFLNDRMIMITGAAAGLLFGLHPMHVESVAWVSERKDLLCAFFFLLTIITYTHYVTGINGGESPNFASRFINKKYLLTLGLFILSLLSKPMAVTLPLVLLILDWYPFRRINSLKTFWTMSAEKLPFFALTGIASFLTVMAQKAGGSVSSIEATPLTSRVVVAAQSLIVYLMKMIVPINLVPFYPYPERVSLFSFEYALPIAVVIAITAACIAVARNRKLWLSVWSYYVITLLPVLGIVQVGEQSMADRYAYLPSLGPFLVIGFIAAQVDDKISALKQRKVFLRKAFFCIAIIMLVSLSYATIQQTGIWKNGIVFWNYVIEKEPSLAFAHDNLGDAYSSAGLSDLAMEQYQAALRLNPYYVQARNNLGAAYLSKGLYDMAIEQFRTAISLKMDFALAHYNLGYAYAFKGQFDTAIEQYRIAISLDPNPAWVYHDLANAYYMKGLFDMAIEQYLIAISLDPNSAEVHYNLGNAYESKGMPDMAIEQYRVAVSLKPDFAEAHYNLGLSYLNKGSKDLARAEFELELTMKPDDHEARRLLNSIISK